MLAAFASVITALAAPAELPTKYLYVYGSSVVPGQLSEVIASDQSQRFEIIEKEDFCIVIDRQSTGLALNEELASGLEEITKGNVEAGRERIHNQIAPLILSWTTDPETQQSPYTSISKADLEPGYGVVLTLRSETIELQSSRPAPENVEWLDVRNQIRTEAPRATGQSTGLLCFLTVGTRLGSEQERARHNLATTLFWDRYEKTKQRYNDAMNACIKAIYDREGIKFNLNRADKGKKISELSPDLFMEMRDIAPGSMDGTMDDATIERVWKTLNVSFSLRNRNGRREVGMYQLLPKLP